MIYHVLHTSNYALTILKSQKTSGIIHSVYRKTINCCIDGKLLAIQAKDSPLSPISLITDMSQTIMEQLPVRSGQLVRQKDNTIFVYPDIPKHCHCSTQNPDFSICQITLQAAKSVDLQLTSSLSEEELESLAKKLSYVICHSDRNGFRLLFANPNKTAHTANISLQDDLVFLVANRRLKKASSFIRIGNAHDAAKELVQLIGLGIGLTPSGDDFLTGILAGLTLCHKQNHPFSIHLRGQIQNHIKDTNDISGAFLTCALENQFSEAVNALPHLPDTNSILESFLQIGHSSGIDTLCGIHYILSLRSYLR